jgi:hypothetical protein
LCLLGLAIINALTLLSFLGCEEVPGDVCEQAPEQDQPGGVRPRHSVCGRRLPLSPHWAARGILCATIRLPSHSAGNDEAQIYGLLLFVHDSENDKLTCMFILR